MARITITEFERDPNSVFVSVTPPKSVQNVQQAESYHRDWTTVASDLASDTPVEEPTQDVITEPPKDAKAFVLEALRDSKLSRSYDWIAERTGLSPLTVHLACRELVDAGQLECEASLTCKKFRLKSKITNDPTEIRIYTEDVLSGKRERIYTGSPTDDTDTLCQAYADLMRCRVEWSSAVERKAFSPEASTIPNLCDWVEVVNADTGELIWAGLREKGFDARCRKYADRTGTGLRVDSAHENRSQFYTPRSERLQYARENARQYAKKYGVPLADAAGVVAIMVTGWFAYIVMGGAV